jgi:hypothetical protein
MDKPIKNYLKLSISLLIISALLLSLPSLIFSDCISVFGGGCRPTTSQNIITLLSYIVGIIVGIIGAICFKKYNDLIDENKKSIKINV